jgi:PAS domain S-box-containing protein
MTDPTVPTPAPKSDDVFQQLADGAPVMIWMSGLDMGCFYFNRAWLEFRGRTLAQESGNGWAEGVHPDDLQRCIKHYVSCFEHRIAFAMSYRLQDFRGRYQWILDRGMPHYLPDGTFLGFFGGCAEIETQTTIARHAALGVSLAEMKVFARHIASEEPAVVRARNAHAAAASAGGGRTIDDAELARRQQHAIEEMGQLARDMLAFREIAPGACVP